jgi:hypothetical protein
MTVTASSEVKDTSELISLLKSGEYDGRDIMQTGCRLRQLHGENERLRETIREALNSNDFAERMAKEPPATDSYGINARRLWAMKEALEENNDER